MNARATVKKVDKTLKTLSSATLSVNSLSATEIKYEDSDDESDGWETDLECDDQVVRPFLRLKILKFLR